MKEPIEKINTFIVAGKLSEARKLLVRSGKAGLYSNDRLGFAKLARRLDLPMLALRILHPIVSLASQRKNCPPATLVEYGASLSLVGAYREAERFFDAVEIEDVKEVLLLRGFNYFAQWSYAEAIPILEKYAALPILTPYEKIIADTNLAIAWVYEKRAEAGDFVDSLIERARSGNYLRIWGNLLLQKAQWEIRNQNWSKAFQTLAVANRQTKDIHSIDYLLIQKWIVFATLSAYPERADVTLQEMEKIRDLAVRAEDWETLRSCDYQEAVVRRNMVLAERFYFGTPHRTLRERFLKDLGLPLLIKKETLFHPPTLYSENNIVCSVLVDGIENSALAFGHLSHRALLALSSDFYRPRKIAELHSELFPDAVFNPLSSPQRIRKILERMRRELKEKGVPLQIRSRHTMLSLGVPNNMALRVPLNRSIHSPLDRMSEGSSEFTIREAVQILKLPYHHVARLVHKASQEKQIEKLGFSKSTHYRFLAKN